MKEKNKQNLNLVLIGLGSNLNPAQNIARAFRHLKSLVTIRNISAIYKSPAIGSDGPDYLNSAVLIETDLDLDVLRKKILLPLENQLGRVRSSDKYMDRTIDLDILIFNQTVTDPDLWTQAHVAIPAAEVLPDFQNPETGEKISQAAERLLPGIDIQFFSDHS